MKPPAASRVMERERLEQKILDLDHSGSWGMEPIFLDAVPELETAVFDERPRFHEAVVNRTVFNSAAAAALAQVDKFSRRIPPRGTISVRLKDLGFLRP
ncbi:MAG TPA: hypothetical protein PLP18_07305 [Smithellaceae bacterium]|nr:hypothetical protein [Smithellaceae bacterium]